MTVRQVCEQAFCELVMLQEQMQALERALENAAGSGGEEDIDVLLKKYTLLQERYEAGGGYEMEERFARICTGLKLSGEFLEAEFRTLSGGEKTLPAWQRSFCRIRISWCLMNLRTIWICPCCSGWRNI